MPLINRRHFREALRVGCIDGESATASHRFGPCGSRSGCLHLVIASSLAQRGAPVVPAPTPAAAWGSACGWGRSRHLPPSLPPRPLPGTGAVCLRAPVASALLGRRPWPPAHTSLTALVRASTRWMFGASGVAWAAGLQAPFCGSRLETALWRCE
eukprot:scaffold1369_cov140-Isochrysis_galbana.AAC.2